MLIGKKCLEFQDCGNICQISQLFIAATPEHWCRIPELEPWAQDYSLLVKNLSIPLNEAGEFSECEMYDRNYSDIVRYLEYRSPWELQKDKVWHIGNPAGEPIIPCQHGWRYSKLMYPNTVVTEVNFKEFLNSEF